MDKSERRILLILMILVGVLFIIQSVLLHNVWLARVGGFIIGLSFYHVLKLIEGRNKE